MKKFMRIGTALFVAVAMLVLIGCPTETETLEKGAELISVTIGGATVTVIPPGVPYTDWQQEEFNAEEMATITIAVEGNKFGASGILTDKSIGVKASSGAAVRYNFSASGIKPATDTWESANNVFDLKDGNYVYLQVTSEDQFAQNIYKVRILALGNDSRLVSMSIAGVNVGIGPNDGAGTLAGASLGSSPLLTFNEGNLNVPVAVETSHPNAQVAFAKVNAGADLSTITPAFTDTPPFALLDEGDMVFVKVTPPDASAPRYYGATIRTTVKVSALGIAGTSQNLSAAGNLIHGYVTEALADTTGNIIEIQRNYDAMATASPSRQLTATMPEGVTVEYSLGNATSYAPITTEQGFGVDYPPHAVTKLYIRISVPGTDYATRYLVLSISKMSTNRAIPANGVDIDGAKSILIGNGGTGVNVAPASLGAIAILDTQSVAGKTVTVAFADPSANVTGYNVITDPAQLVTAEDYTTLNPPAKTFTLPAGGINDGNHLILRVASESGAVYYHRLAVSVYDSSNGALVTTMSVGGQNTYLGIPSDNISEVISGLVNIPATILSNDENPVIFSITAVSASSVQKYLIKGTGDGDPVAGDFDDDGSPIGNIPALELEDGDIIWIQSVLNTQTLYYKIVVAEAKSSNAAITASTNTATNTTLGGVKITALGTQNSVKDLVVPGSVTLPSATLSTGNIVFEVVKGEANSTQYYQLRDVGEDWNEGIGWDEGNILTAVPPNRARITIPSITDGQVLWVRSTAQDGVTILYYGIVVTAGD